MTVYTYRCVGTIEERIAEILTGKQELFDEVIDPVSEQNLDYTGRCAADRLVDNSEPADKVGRKLRPTVLQ